MSRKTEQVLAQIFAHPLPMNLKWRDVTHMLDALGAELEVVHGGREKVRLNGLEHTFHIPHGKMLDSRDEIMQIRRFLTEAGVTPEGH